MPAVVVPAPKLGRGVYGAPEAARIADLPSRRVRRWLAGYTFRGRDGSERHSGPMFTREHSSERLAINFADLVELLFVGGFVSAGVPTRIVRIVHREASEEFGTSHPFTLKRFEHDGRTIIERVRGEGEERLVDRYRAQHLMKAVMLPLVRRLTYDEITEEARRFYPLGTDRPVVIDPARSFGEPTIARRGVPTRIVFGARKAGESLRSIASWYGLALEEVEAAIEYETTLQARKAA